MSNGANAFGVSYAQISWASRMLQQHDNVIQVTRTNDIQFDIERVRGAAIRMVCLNEYTCGFARVLGAQESFPGINLVYVGGNWNSYTLEAKEYCLAAQIGLFNSSEMTGALHRNDFWTYHRKDKDGNPVYESKD